MTMTYVHHHEKRSAEQVALSLLDGDAASSWRRHSSNEMTYVRKFCVRYRSLFAYLSIVLFILWYFPKFVMIRHVIIEPFL